MDDFDHDARYYRILGSGDGYIYRTDEPEQILTGAVAHDHPYYEFDDLASIGSWLFLGDRVLVLKVPRDALVEHNTPMSQGGCMAYSASRIEPLAIISFAELMQTYDAADHRPGSLHLARQTLADDLLKLPARGADWLNLSHCTGSVDLSRVTGRICLWQCTLDVTRWPEHVGELSVTHGTLRGRLPRSRNLSISHVDLDAVVHAGGATHTSLFRCTGSVDLTAARNDLTLTGCDLELLALPDAPLKNLYADDCRLRGDPRLPSAKNFQVKNITRA